MKRSGSYKTNLSGEMMYKSFLPSPLPPSPDLQLDEQMNNLLIKANATLAQLEAISTRLPNIALFVSMYVRKEALLSSQIEGTQATLDDILDPWIEKNTNQNVADVVDYIKATDFAIEKLKQLPLCCRLLLETHKVLLGTHRGSDKNPGEFRRSQNWIGSIGSTLKNARYVPPSVEDMKEAMSDLEKYINAEDDMDPLIKIALIHYQFETIHPFLDGNGRIGRLMINLYLKQNQLLSHPTLYISYYLKRNRVEYYDRLSEVREKGNYEQWVKFFLYGIIESAADSISTIDLLCALHDKNEKLIASTKSRSNILKKLFEYIERVPIIDIQKTASELNCSFNTMDKAVKKMVELGILIQTSEAKRERRFAYEEYIAILRKDS